MHGALVRTQLGPIYGYEHPRSAHEPPREESALDPLSPAHGFAQDDGFWGASPPMGAAQAGGRRSGERARKAPGRVSRAGVFDQGTDDGDHLAWIHETTGAPIIADAFRFPSTKRTLGKIGATAREAIETIANADSMFLRYEQDAVLCTTAATGDCRSASHPRGSSRNSTR